MNIGWKISSFSDNINVLFNDAVTCYKAGANRVSLLFSYLDFLTILKERIIEANTPNLFPQGQWDKMVRLLQVEDAWEAVTFDATQ